MSGVIPETTARHHNMMVIALDNGVPVVAASNPTDVFAMDDLRTILGSNFILVVATRTQISAYIGRAFNSGGRRRHGDGGLARYGGRRTRRPAPRTSRSSPRRRRSSAT